MDRHEIEQAYPINCKVNYVGKRLNCKYKNAKVIGYGQNSIIVRTSTGKRKTFSVNSIERADSCARVKNDFETRYSIAKEACNTIIDFINYLEKLKVKKKYPKRGNYEK